MREQTIHAVVLKEGKWWVIQGLEYDFVTLARRREDVPSEIRRFLLAMFAASLEQGIEPFQGFSPAPRKFWDLYEQAVPWGDPVAPVDVPGGLGPGPQVEARLAA